MKNLTLLLTFFTFGFANAQTIKGGQANSMGAHPITIGSTRAVVVGISDYQDPAITDLRFADKDAEAFAAWLQSPSGGEVDSDHVKLLTNQQATHAQFGNSLDWLVDESKEGDLAIIYFSGHGDVETRSINQEGFLLCWDSPPQSYTTSAFPVYFLKGIVATLSLKNKSKVIVITDACHAGMLAGSSINGSQLTSHNLAQQFANEIKVLSCQPDEYSLEGEQWGSGRGLFSYYLVDGLYGLADANNDGYVTLLEIGRYLEDHVTADAAPVRQAPMVMGNKLQNLAKAIPDIVTAVKKGKAGQMQHINQTSSKGLEEDVLANVDTSLQRVYRLFKKSLEERVFLEPEGACAETYYRQLMAEPKLGRLHNTIRRNYAAALQDDAQQVLNLWMKTDMAELLLSKAKKTDKYKIYPRYLSRAAELLGESHYMFPVLKARQAFFEGYLLALSNHNTNQELGEAALDKMKQALALQPALSPAYWQMSNIFGNNLNNPDSASYYSLLAASFSPGWILPLTSMAYLYTNKFNKPAQAKFFLEKANQIDSTSTAVSTGWGFYYLKLKDYGRAAGHFSNAIAKDTSNANAYTGLGHAYYWSRQLEQAEAAYKAAFGLDSTLAYACINLGFIYSHYGGHIAERENLYRKAIQLDSANSIGYYNLGQVYIESGRPLEAERQYNVVKRNLGEIIGHDYLAFVYLETDRFSAAAEQYQMAVALDSMQWALLANLGATYQYFQAWQPSIKSIQKALELNPNTAELMAILGNAYLHLPDRNKEGEALLKKAAELKPDYPDTYIYLAQSSVLKKDKKSAWKHLETGLQLGFGKEQLRFRDLNLIPEFQKMRKTGKWKKLMKQYSSD